MIKTFHGLYDAGMDTPAFAHARALDLPRVDELPVDGFYLTVVADRLTLCQAGTPPGLGVSVDFGNADIGRRIAAGRRQPLARALGLHKHAGIRVLDATCGLGRDSAVVAGLGCQLTALERHPALHALLRDGLRRADSAVVSWRENWQSLQHGDGLNWLTCFATANRFDVIYIDPMFDNRRRKARPQRALQWLAELVGADDDAAALVAEARRHARRRVVVKSHARAAPLAPPDHQVHAKAVRFDVYFSAAKDLR